MSLFLTERKFFWTFALVGILLSAAMVFGSWFYGGENFFSNLIDFIRPVSNEKRIQRIEDLFRDFWPLFLPFVFVSLDRPKKWMSVLIYFSSSLLIGSYAIGGVGVGGNAWFDFVIAAAIVFGLLAARSPAIIWDTFSYYTLTSLGIGMILVGALAIVLESEFMSASYMNRRGILALSTVVIGIMLIAIRRIAATFGRILIPDRVTVLKGFGQRILVYGILAISILPFCTSLKVSLAQVLDYNGLKQRDEAHRRDVALLQSIAGAVLFEDLLLGFGAGKELLFDPFSGSVLISSGRIPERILLDPIRQKYFAAIVLDTDLEQTLKHLDSRENDFLKPRTSGYNRWTDNTLRVIKDNYVLLDPKSHNLRFFYVPRKTI